MGDWADELPSDEDDVTEIENDLYSMFYYHSMTDGIPKDLSKKYDVDVDDFGVTVSLKNTTNDFAPSVNDGISIESEESVTIYNNRYIEGGKGEKDLVPNRQGDFVEDNSVNDVSKKSISVDDISKRSISVDVVSEDLPKKLPTQSPVPQITPRTSKFQSSRYFFQGDTVTYKEKVKYKDNYHLTHFYKNQSHLNNNGSLKSYHHKAIFSSTPVKKRKSNHLYQTPLKRNNNETDDLVIENDNTDMIDLTENKKKRKKKNSKNKNEVPVILISDSDTDFEGSTSISVSESSPSESESDSEFSEVKSFSSILLNTSIPVDQNYCDISVINIDYDWKQTSSPEGWTQSMRKFYNKPSKKHLYFDYEDILQEIRSQGCGDWSINKADTSTAQGKHKYRNSQRIRCLRCQQEGHVKSQCTKVISCHMCGTPGHNSTKCPQKMCLKCGSKCRDFFPSGCNNCINGEKSACSVCGITGHNSTNCTDAWRSQFMNEESRANKERTKYCCNCGKSGHYYEDCSTSIEMKPSNSNGGKWKDWKTFKARFKKNRGPKLRKNGKNDLRSFLQIRKNNKYNVHSNILNNPFNERHMALDLHFSDRRTKQGKASKRILMLRKNKRNMFKACHSNAF